MCPVAQCLTFSSQLVGHSDTAKQLWRHSTSFLAIIDFLSVFPYYLEILFHADTVSPLTSLLFFSDLALNSGPAPSMPSRQSVLFRFSILRTFRLLRVFRAFRYSNTVILTIEVCQALVLAT